ncbi:MAG: MFS transporter [Alkalispirochaeta sp.]
MSASSDENRRSRSASPPPSGAHRDLHLLVAGNVVSTFGNSLYLIAVTLLLKELTQSAFVLGVFQFLALSPGFFLSPITGALIDRTSRLKVVVFSDLYRGVLMVGGGALLLIPALRTPWLVLPLSLAAGIGHAFFVPAAQALLPSLVPPERLPAANGLRAGASQAANLTGNAAGGALYVLLGAPMLFMLNGITFLFSAWQEHCIRADGNAVPRVLLGQGVAPDDRVPLGQGVAPDDGVPSAPGASTARGAAALRGVLSSAAAGISLIRSDRALRLLVVSQAGLFAISPVLMLSLPFVVIDELNLGEHALGVYFAAALAGGIGVFLALRGVSAEGLLRFRLPIAAYAVITVVFAAVAISITPVLLAVAAFLTGGAAAVVYLYTITWIQHRSGEEFHGRVFAILEAATSLVAPVSYLLTGIVLEVLGSEQRWMAYGVVAAAAAVWTVILIVSWRPRRPTGE